MRLVRGATNWCWNFVRNRRMTTKKRDTVARPTKLSLYRLDTRAFVAGIPNSEFSSPLQLGAVLASSTLCQECIVRQYFRYQAGRTDTPADRPLLNAVTENFRSSGFHFKELILSLVVLREFPDSQSAENSPHRGDSLENVADNHRSR